MESGVEGDGATGHDSDTQVSSSDNMDEFESLSFLGVTKAGAALSETTSSVDRVVNASSRVAVEIGMVYIAMSNYCIAVSCSASICCVSDRE